MEVLIVDDDFDSAHVLAHTLKTKGYKANVVGDGVSALNDVQAHKYDALLIDWMLPKMDGIELIRQVRKVVRPAPIVMMLTAISHPKARVHALKAGADDYVAKPYDPLDVVKRLDDDFARRAQNAPPVNRLLETPPAKSLPAFIALSIATSTGGPLALRTVLQQLPRHCRKQSAIFVVLHAPDWMLSSLPSYLQGATEFSVKLAEHRAKVEPGNLYLAPANKHMVILPEKFELRLTDDDKENFVRPSADPLFRSMAATFGRFQVAAVMTGMGRDGARGAAQVAAAGGVVVAQDPETATAPSMPATIIESGIAIHVPPLDRMGELLGQEVARLALDLKLAQ